MTELDIYQKQAVYSEHENTVVTACPGAGKTTVICERVKRTLDIRGIVYSKSDIVLITYTNAAANEFRERLPGGKVDCLAFCGTIHGFAKWFLDHYCLDPDGNKVPMSVMDETETLEQLQRIADAMRLKLTKTGLKEIARRTDEPKQGVLDDPEEILYRAHLKEQWNTARYSFAGLLYFTRRELKRLGGRKFDLIVDEYQDASASTHELLQALPTRSRFYVGDANQCQPGWTMVLTEKGPRRMDELTERDTVKSFDRKAGRITGGHKIKIASRDYVGELIRVTVGDRETYCTPNHKWLVRWTDRESDDCVVYLMWRKGFGFRIGWCQLFQHCESIGTNGLHFFTRCKLDKADKGWILGTFKNRAEASVEESVISLKYGIPTVMFETRIQTPHYTGNAIKRIFEAADESRGYALLEDCGKSFERPIYETGGKRTRTTFLTVTADNLISGYHSVPTEVGGDWETVKVHRGNKYVGKVWSLDVEKTHAYIADGICTLNSIFGFIGGSPTRLMELVENSVAFPSEWAHIQLQNTYRCAWEIAEAANKIVDRLPSRTVMASRQTEPGQVDLNEYNTSSEEQMAVAKAVMELTHVEDEASCAVLCRTNAQCEDMRAMLRNIGVLVKERVRGEQLPGLRQALVILDYLDNPKSESRVEAVNRLVMPPSMFAEEKRKALKECREMSGPKGDFDFLATSVSNQIPIETIRTILKAQRTMNGDGTPGDLAMLLRSPDFEAEAPESAEHGVEVTTVHGAKGLEWDAVWIVGANECYWKGSADEERRLFYVALTRARLFASVSWACMCARSVKGRVLDPVASDPIPAVRELAEFRRRERSMPRTRVHRIEGEEE